MFGEEEPRGHFSNQRSEKALVRRSSSYLNNCFGVESTKSRSLALNARTPGYVSPFYSRCDQRLDLSLPAPIMPNPKRSVSTSTQRARHTFVKRSSQINLDDEDKYPAQSTRQSSLRNEHHNRMYTPFVHSGHPTRARSLSRYTEELPQPQPELLRGRSSSQVRKEVVRNLRTPILEEDYTMLSSNSERSSDSPAFRSHHVVHPPNNERQIEVPVGPKSRYGPSIGSPLLHHLTLNQGILGHHHTGF